MKVYETYQTTYTCSAVSTNFSGLNFQYDSDSFVIGIDNHASKTMSNKIRDFITPLTPTPNTFVKGAGGYINVMGSGTLRWRIEDDDGKVHTILVKDSLYVPNIPKCLLSCQHWAKQANDNFPKPKGTWCATYDDSCVMEWNQRRYRRTIQMDPITNTPNILSAPGFNAYRKKAAALDCLLTETSALQQTVAFSATTDHETSKSSNDENVSDFMKEINEKTINLQEDFNTSALTDKGELLRWHYRLGHLSFLKMRILMMLGILPKKLIHVRPPVCACCLAGAMTRQPKKVKGGRQKLRRAANPG